MKKLVVTLAFALSLGCSSADDEFKSGCEENTVKACLCDDGTGSTQVCASDGSKWSACTCESGGAGSGGGSTAVAVADPVVDLDSGTLAAEFSGGFDLELQGVARTTSLFLDQASLRIAGTTDSVPITSLSAEGDSETLAVPPGNSTHRLVFVESSDVATGASTCASAVRIDGTVTLDGEVFEVQSGYVSCK